MRHFELAPLYRAPLNRTTIGFDQIADLMDRVLTNDVSTPAYPPYNIEKTADDGWRISIAVAGFSDTDLTVELREKSLLVSARKADTAPDITPDRRFLHRGIATRAFERRFHLADHVRVTGASHIDGMLHIDLLREVPEALKPRQIQITRAQGNPTPLVEGTTAN